MDIRGLNEIIMIHRRESQVMHAKDNFSEETKQRWTTQRQTVDSLRDALGSKENRYEKFCSSLQSPDEYLRRAREKERDGMMTYRVNLVEYHLLDVSMDHHYRQRRRYSIYFYPKHDVLLLVRHCRRYSISFAFAYIVLQGFLLLVLFLEDLNQRYYFLYCDFV